jgi:hypothetical protein
VSKWFNWVTIIAYALGAFTGAWLTSLLRGVKGKVA